MPIRNGIPLTFRPSGVTDSVDATNAAQGSMQQLSNLVPDPATDHVFVPRPASELKIDFTTGGFSSPGFVSGYDVIGDTVYGMVATARNAAHDEPFVYDLLTDTFTTVSGVTSGNTPTSPPTSGQWNPPIVAQIGSRVIVCHPGFPGGQTKFGWFDISGFNQTTIGDTVTGSAVITGFPEILGIQAGMTIVGSGIPASTTVLYAASAFTGISFTGDTHGTVIIDNISSTTGMFAGFALTGPGVAPNTTIISVDSGTQITISTPTTTSVVAGDFIVLSPSPSYAGYVTGTLTSGSPTIAVTSTAGLWVGQQVNGLGIPINSKIISIVANTSITLDQNATVTGTVTFSVAGTIIVMSANATATANNVSITIAGGTVASPLWGAGDTQPNNLASIPLGVAQMAGRAYYVCGLDGIRFSDSGFPCQISDTARVQALTTSDGLACTAIGPLQLASLTGGIVQSLVVFEGATKMQQITGDMATNNLAMNALPVATGTLAPLTVCPMELGLAFVSPHGLRIVDFVGRVSPPIGDHGTGVAIPFLYALTPSRMCAASVSDIIRITVQNDAVAGDPFQEWWYDLTRKIWTGPHTSVCDQIQPWGDTFICELHDITGKLYRSDAQPTPGSVFIENNVQLSWTQTTSLLPDSAGMNMNAVTLMNLACALATITTTGDIYANYTIDNLVITSGIYVGDMVSGPGIPDDTLVTDVSGGVVTISRRATTAAIGVTLVFTPPTTAVAISDFGNIMAQTNITGDNFAVLWNEVIWNQFVWNDQRSIFRQRSVNFPDTLIFKQMAVQVSGQSALNVRIGNLYMLYQKLGYSLEEAS